MHLVAPSERAPPRRYKSKDGEEDVTLQLTLQEKDYRRVYREAGGDYGQARRGASRARGLLEGWKGVRT